MARDDTETKTFNEETEVHGVRDNLYYFETVISSLPPGDNGKGAEGATDARPIVLEGISKIAFHGFLRAIYPSSDVPWTYEEMLGALHLSTMWGFSELRKSAIERLSPSIEGNPTYDSIVLARQRKVKEWLLDAYVTLGLRPGASLEILELYKQGLDGLTITKLFMVREGAIKMDSQRATTFVKKRWKGSLTYLPKNLQA
ncbi:hypothetical protein BJ912DRAFT_314553 [Pholiota molesta]|nr:hypothetical protein BJ912DRAFT_314553 [Pholiota molesta]